MRFFLVFTISLFLQIQLVGAATKVNTEYGGLAIITTKGAAEVHSYPGDLQKSIGKRSKNQTAIISAAKTKKQFQEDPAKILASKTVSKGAAYIHQEGGITIFVAAGTTVVGLNDVDQVKVIPETRKNQPVKVSKSSFSAQNNQARSENKDNKKLARLAKKVREKAVCRFSTSPAGDSGITGRSGKTKTFVVLSSNVLQKHALASTYAKLLISINAQLEKQKFNTSLSYLQFRKYCSSSLRGPPYVA